MAFFGDDVQELRAGLRAHEAADVFQRGNERVQVVPVDGADVVEAEFLEQGAGRDHAFGAFFQAARQLQQRRHGAEHGFAHVAGGGVELAAHELGQVAVERAHGGADAHVVVVEHDK